MVDYCDILCNWECDKDPTYVIDYLLDSEQNEQNESGCISFPSKLQIFNSTEDDTTCQLSVQCKSLYHVGIKGVRFVSESRNVEVYGLTEGYIQTLRGKAAPNTDETVSHFISDFSTEEPFLCLTFKFLSLKGKMSFEIKRIQITLTQMEPPDETSQMDISKLRSHVKDLGDKVSDKAMSLLETMEQYQKNQRGTLDSVRSMISQSSLPEDKGSSLSGMAGLLTMFSQMSQKMPRNTRKPPETVGSGPEDPSSLAGNLFSQISNGHNGDAMHSEDMYRFLHSVCGKVSKMRPTKTEESSSEMALDSSKEAVSESEKATAVEPVVMEEVKKRIQAAEERLTKHMETRLSEMENRLNKKMDRILQLLSPTEEEEEEEQEKENATGEVCNQVPQAIELD